MRILIYGAGVLGSYLAYEMNKVGHDVSILARGKRYNNIKDHGLVIEHHMQKKTTTSDITVINTFKKTYEYDAVFVVMQKTQIDDVLPILAANEKCKLYIMVGNNGNAEKTYSDFMNMSCTEKTVLFGFLGSGGRRENHSVISIHKNKVDFAIGDIKKRTEYKEIIGEIFSGTNIKPWYCDNVDSWLKYHLAIILPLAYGVHWAEGDMRKLSRSREILYLIIEGIHEGIAVLSDLDYPPEPESVEKMMRWPWLISYLFLKIMTGSKLGKLAVGDHAMAAVSEMNLLAEEFSQIIRKSRVGTPALDRLQSYLMK